MPWPDFKPLFRLLLENGQAPLVWCHVAGTLITMVINRVVIGQGKKGTWICDPSRPPNLVANYQNDQQRRCLTLRAGVFPGVRGQQLSPQKADHDFTLGQLELNPAFFSQRWPERLQWLRSLDLFGPTPACAPRQQRRSRRRAPPRQKYRVRPQEQISRWRWIKTKKSPLIQKALEQLDHAICLMN
jgi:hypothetical protein